jgi:hypothetical protein
MNNDNVGQAGLSPGVPLAVRLWLLGMCIVSWTLFRHAPAWVLWLAIAGFYWWYPPYRAVKGASGSLLLVHCVAPALFVGIAAFIFHDIPCLADFLDIGFSISNCLFVVVYAFSVLTCAMVDRGMTDVTTAYASGYHAAAESPNMQTDTATSDCPCERPLQFSLRSLLVFAVLCNVYFSQVAMRGSLVSATSSPNVSIVIGVAVCWTIMWAYYSINHLRVAMAVHFHTGIVIFLLAGAVVDLNDWSNTAAFLEVAARIAHFCTLVSFPVAILEIVFRRSRRQ